MGRISLGKNQDGTPNRKSLYGHTLWDVQEKCAIAMREYQESRIRASESTASATGVSISGQQSHGMVITSTGAMTIRVNGGMVIAVDAGASVNVSNAHAE